MKTPIKKQDVVEYTNHKGYKVKGRVISVYKSATGQECVHINSFKICRFVSEVTQ